MGTINENENTYKPFMLPQRGVDESQIFFRDARFLPKWVSYMR
jgi:hypothetical protein